MNRNRRKIEGGLYLVLDPSAEKMKLLKKLRAALKGGVKAVQIWNHWQDHFTKQTKQALVEEILIISKKFEVPVLINNEWKLLEDTDLDGVHFDDIPENFEKIQSAIGREFISGITCSNNLDIIRWADEKGFDYISFCSMFPSDSVDSCEIVKPETVRKARDITDLPLFISGGITPDNLKDFEGMDFQGVAVISGIMNSNSPGKSAKSYLQVLDKYRSKSY